jgi:glycine/D-amino acid oxidase-like deaminating enzyme
MGTTAQVAVIGAGVAGLSVAIHLRRFGHSVTVIDPLEPPGGASFGNAGLICPDSCVPICKPGMLRHVPRWLGDPDGPLRIDPSYLVAVAPWLLRWIASGRRNRMVQLSAALHVLHRAAWDEYRAMLGSRWFDDLMRPSALVLVRNTRPEGSIHRLERELEGRLGISRELIDSKEINRMFPGISREISYGEVLSRDGYVVSTARLFRTLAELVRQEGAHITHEQVLKIIPRDGDGWRIITNARNHIAAKVVVAAGAWSARLLVPLGIRIPLESLRGYHVMLPSPSLGLGHALIHPDWAIAVTPMEEGLRVAGTLEFAGLDAAPNEQRAAVLHRRVTQLFPALSSTEPSWWMGHRPCLPDDLPVLGAVAGRPGLYVCFGHGVHGLSGGPLSGRVVAELVADRNPSIDLAPYEIQRFRRMW